MKQQIYQNGFYLMIGVFLGLLISVIISPKPQPSTNTIKQDTIKVVKVDTIRIKDEKKVSQNKPKELNEHTLKAELVKNNIPHSNIVLAQAKLETGNFTSSLVKSHQNIFGLKRGNNYRKYSHWTECVQDYKKCISSRYQGGSYYTFLNKIGYASNPNYTNLLKEIA